MRVSGERVKGGTLHLVELAGAVVFTVTGSVDSKTTSISSWPLPLALVSEEKKTVGRFRFEQRALSSPSQPPPRWFVLSMSRYICGLPSSKTCAAVPPHAPSLFHSHTSRSPEGPDASGVVGVELAQTRLALARFQPPFSLGSAPALSQQSSPTPPTRVRTQDRPPCNPPTRPHAPRCGLDLGRPATCVVGWTAV